MQNPGKSCLKPSIFLFVLLVLTGLCRAHFEEDAIYNEMIESAIENVENNEASETSQYQSDFFHLDQDMDRLFQQADDEEEIQVDKKERLEMPQYWVQGDIILPSFEAVDDTFSDAKRSDPQVLNAARYVMNRVNEAKVRCRKRRHGTFGSFEVVYALEEPSMGVSFLMELKLIGNSINPEVYHVSVQELMEFEKSVAVNALTGEDETLDHRIRSIQPNPCNYQPLGHTFLQVRIHNSAPENTWNSTIYRRFFGKTRDHIAASSFGSFDADISEVDPSSVKQVIAKELASYKPPREYFIPTFAHSVVFDQGPCGCCYAAASAVVLSSRLAKATNGKVDIRLSVDEIMDCVIGKCIGNSAENVFSRMITNPISEEWCLPDRGTTLLSPYHARAAVPTGGGYCGASCTSTNGAFSAKWGVKDYYMLDTSGLDAATRVLAIQREIQTNGPVYASLDITEEFLAYKTGIFSPKNPGRVLGAHAVAIVGWGNGQDGVPYWYVQNSYSEYWGFGGFANVRMGLNAMNIETKSIWAPSVVTHPLNSVGDCKNWDKCKHRGSMDSNCKCRCRAPYHGDDCGSVSAGSDACGFGAQPRDNTDRDQCWCSGVTAKDSSGKCTLVRFGLDRDSYCRERGSAPFIVWNTPSRIGSYCILENLEVQTAKIRIDICGKEKDYSPNRSLCPAFGNVSIPLSYFQKNAKSMMFELNCFAYLGWNEFKASRGYVAVYPPISLLFMSGADCKIGEDTSPTTKLQKLLPQERKEVPLANRQVIDKYNSVFIVHPDGHLYSKGPRGECTVITREQYRVNLDFKNVLFAVAKTGNRIPLSGSTDLYVIDNDGILVKAKDQSGRVTFKPDQMYFSLVLGKFVLNNKIVESPKAQMVANGDSNNAGKFGQHGNGAVAADSNNAGGFGQHRNGAVAADSNNAGGFGQHGNGAVAADSYAPGTGTEGNLKPTKRKGQLPKGSKQAPGIRVTAAPTKKAIPPTAAPTKKAIPPTAAPTKKAIPPTAAPTKKAIPPNITNANKASAKPVSANRPPKQEKSTGNQQIPKHNPNMVSTKANLNPPIVRGAAKPKVNKGPGSKKK